jgi:uncharacterized protein YacL
VRPAWPRNLLLRLGFVLAAMSLSVFSRPLALGLVPSAALAALLALAVLALERGLRRVDTATLMGCSLGVLLGLSAAAAFANIFGSLLTSGSARFLLLFCPLATGFLGVSVAAAKSGSLRTPSTGSSLSATAVVRYFDSSALVDGRIVALAEAGFIDGLVVVPQFVLNELQTVADTADPLRRNRGRRGLDSVAQLRKVSGIEVEISPEEFADFRGVDLKLIEAARARQAQIVTTDFNLGKLAQAQGVRVLNVNEIASVLRPVVLQGETLRVSIAKEGKESAQGLAYLEDGTMVVVENANRQIGKTIDIVVTGVVQSVTGKMIFGRYEGARAAGRSRNAG